MLHLSPRRSSDTQFGLTTVLGYSAITQAFIATPAVYSVLQLGIYFGFGALLLYHVPRSKHGLDNPVLVLFGLVITIDVALRATLTLFRDQNLMERPALLIPFLLILLGYTLNVAPKTRQIAFVYGICAGIASWFVIATYGGLAAFGETQYFFAPKNQLGAMIGAAIALLLYELWSEIMRRRPRLLATLALALLIAVDFAALLILRNRSTLIGVLVLLLIILLKTILSPTVKLQVKLSLTVTVSLAFVFWGNLALATLRTALLSTQDPSDLNSLSSNRVDVYAMSLQFLKSNLLLGDLGQPSHLPDPHNFVLFQLVRYGLLLSLGTLIIYFHCVLRTLQEWLRGRIDRVPTWAFLLLVGSVVSLFEYAQPFGPGTTQCVTWVLFGAALATQKSKDRP